MTANPTTTTCAVCGCNAERSSTRTNYCTPECRNAAKKARERARDAKRRIAANRDPVLAARLAHLLDAQRRGVQCDRLPSSVTLMRAGT